MILSLKNKILFQQQAFPARHHLKNSKNSPIKIQKNMVYSTI